ncbi:MAG TPA: hypothetical protein VFL83_10285 [Anaeromyxobacter sp.]|nr:hypothetical protein [Anaeromyxobacter sp.]
MLIASLMYVLAAVAGGCLWWIARRRLRGLQLTAPGDRGESRDAR